MDTPKPAPQQLNVAAEAKDLKGRYANLVAVRHQERDVVLDFISAVGDGQGSQGQLVARIFLNPVVAKDLIMTLQQNVTQWEKMKYELPPSTAGQPKNS